MSSSARRDSSGRELLLRQFGEIGLELGLVGVEALVHGLQLLQRLDAAGAERVERGVEHALQKLRHAHGFEQHIGERHGGRLRRLGIEVARAGQPVLLARVLGQEPRHELRDKAGERQEDEAHEDVEGGMEADRRLDGAQRQQLHMGRDALDEGEAQDGDDAAAQEIGERQAARRGRLRQRGRDGGKPAAEIDAEDEGQRARRPRGCRWRGRRR